MQISLEIQYIVKICLITINLSGVTRERHLPEVKHNLAAFSTISFIVEIVYGIPACIFWKVFQEFFIVVVVARLPHYNLLGIVRNLKDDILVLVL